MKTFTLSICLLISTIASFAADPFSVCIESENSSGTAPVSDDPNASNGKTRGVKTEWDHYVDYEVNNAPAGSYDLTIRYYAEGNAAVYVSVNGNETVPNADLPATHSWNIVWAEQTIHVDLAAGYNKIRIGGKASGRPVRQDKICLTKTGGSGPDPLCDYIVGSIVSDYTPTCGQGIAVSADCFGTGCAGLNHKWSGPGVDISGTSSINFVAPTQNGTFTYTRTSSKAGCPDVVSEFKLTITDCGDGPFKLCLESEDAGGTGPVTEDPNASGGKTRGGQDRSDYTMYYLVHDVQRAASHKLTLRYYAEANTAVDLTVNEGTPRRVQLPASNSWNIVWTEQTIEVDLRAGLNTIYIQGLNGYSPVRHDKICLEEIPGTETPPTCDFSLNPGPSTMTPTCSGQFSLNTECTGPDCGAVNYRWTGNGLDAPTKDVLVNTPGTNGTYTYTLTATKEGCFTRTFSYDVTVYNCPPSGEPFIACVEAEHVGGSGPVSSDPNASNGQTRGAENDYNHYVDYRVDGVGQAGIYPITLRYYAKADAQVKVVVNGAVVIPVLQLPATYSWNIVAREETFYVNLTEGNNIIQINGLPGASCRQDKICVGNRRSNARMAAAASILPQTDTPSLQAYPNPAAGEFKAVFHLEAGETGTIRVIDVQGKVWHTRSTAGKGTHEERIRLSNAPDGIYLLQVKKPDSVETKKILLTH